MVFLPFTTSIFLQKIPKFKIYYAKWTFWIEVVNGNFFICFWIWIWIWIWILEQKIAAEIAGVCHIDIRLTSSPRQQWVIIDIKLSNWAHHQFPLIHGNAGNCSWQGLDPSHQDLFKIIIVILFASFDHVPNKYVSIQITTGSSIII
jgi:hypothetical protein